MSTKFFAVQSTQYAHVVAPESAFSTDSEHTTLSAARKALSKARGEMRSACGPNSWSCNFRIIALRNVTMRSSCCDCETPENVTWVWPAGEVCPYHSYQCDRCADYEYPDEQIGDEEYP